MSGALAGSGKDALDEWLEEDVANRETYRELKRDFLAGKGIGAYSNEEVERQLNLFHRRRERRRGRIYFYYAAVSVILLIIGITILMRWEASRNELPLANSPVSIQVAQGQVMLELSSGERVGLADSLQLELKESSGRISVSGQELRYRESNASPCEEVYNTLFVPRGTEYKVHLSDGTVVWLNAESELRYPVYFTGKRRTVYLKGEGYFEVAPDKARTFTVKTDGGVDVKVLGTKFNISAYADDGNVIATLAEGGVELVMPGDSTRMQPNEQVVFDKKDKTYYSRDVDASVYSAWKDGKFIFEDQSLEYVMERLKRWYDMDVFYADEEVRNYRLTGDLKKYEDFGQAVRMIEEVAGLKIDINNKSVTIRVK